jgi:hypothetical protein
MNGYENVIIYLIMEYCSAIKKNEIISFIGKRWK